MAALPRAATSIRARASSLMLPATNRLDDAWRQLSRVGPVRDLATPPAGSGLEAVRGDRGLPLLGHTLDYIRFGSDFTRDRFHQFGPVSWMGAFGTRIVVIAGPEATQQALTARSKSLSQDGWLFLVDAFFHRGLMLLSFDEHKLHRRIMQEAFTRDRLTGYVGQVTPCVRDTVPTWPVATPTQIYPLLKDLTLDIATQVFMGGRGSRDDATEINTAFVACVRAASAIVRAPLPGTRWQAGVKGRAVLEDYFVKHLPDARNGTGNDLFSGLCHARTPDGESFTDDDVISHMIFLMMAAHDTSTITVTAATYFLAKHPHWQDRARAESDALGDPPLDIDTLEGLTTLDLVIKETLRLVAPVPIVMRKSVEDTEIAGRHIPAGALIAVAPAVNHFDPDCWSHPDTFDPERFATDRREDQSHRFAWLPFGGGVHKCIGLHFGTLEVKAILHQMLLTHTWTVPDGYHARWDNTSLPVPADGLPVTLTRR